MSLIGGMAAPRRGVALVAAILAVVLAVGAAIAFWSTRPIDPWKPTTVPRTAACESGCTVIGEFDTAHGPRIRVTEQPNVDDPVAQWADCLTSIRVCTEREGRGAFAGCVAKAACPALCITEFERRTGVKPDVERLRAAFEATFLADGAPCLPRVERPSTRSGDRK